MASSLSGADAALKPECTIRPADGIPSTAVTDCAKRLKSLVRRYSLSLSVLDGEVDGAPLRTIVADDGSVLPYFASIIYPAGYTQHNEGSVSSLGAPKLANSQADLAVIGANQYLLPFYPRETFIFIPKFVRTFLPVYDHPDAMIGQLPPSVREDIRRNIRRMQERGFVYEIVSDDESFDRFYRDMYSPYVEQRHGQLARRHDYRHIKSYFKRGFILLIKKGDTAIAGTVSFLCGQTLCNTYLGVAGGDQSLAREGASTALYYYSLQFAYTAGCTGVDFGNSRPFLSDGSLRYKLKWGAQVVDIDDGIGVYAVATPGCTEHARKFLCSNKFFHFSGKGIQLCESY